MMQRIRRYKRPLILLFGLMVVVGVVEGVRFYSFYQDVNASRNSLLSIRQHLALESLQDPDDEIRIRQQELIVTTERLESAESFLRTDPFIFAASQLPVINKQMSGLRTSVKAANEAAKAGVVASDVVLSFDSFDGTGEEANGTSIEQAISFLMSQEETMAQVTARYQSLVELEADLPEGLWGPLGSAKQDLADALERLGELVDGYDRAQNLLPELFGYTGPRSYLLLPQNDTQLFPSGGLISSYAIVTFDQGRLVSVEIEYFSRLFERWQEMSGGEYIEPPGPLRNYLKGDLSWGLGESGWYPDFPTTAELAQDFVQRAGVPGTDGTIAIDLKFIAALLDLVGPVDMPGYEVTIDSNNLSEMALELSRDGNYQPGEPHEAFLSHLTESLLQGLYEIPRDDWLDLLKVLDRMGSQRHLQLHFADEAVQAMSHEYGFDGAIRYPSSGDYLLVADTSVRSTKLNLILVPSIDMRTELSLDGSVRSTVTYQIQNPLPEWAEGRDQDLVWQLMLNGTYGSYLRYYLPRTAQLIDLSEGDGAASLEQLDREYDKTVVGHFFQTGAGATNHSRVTYETDHIIEELQDGRYVYQLHVQKQAGTLATPFSFEAVIPEGVRLIELRLDGEAISDAPQIETTLIKDRTIELIMVND